MYELFYKLKAEPFRLSPDHRFCFNHRSYSKAKSYMQYAFRRAEGFVMITGRPGTGKTTLVNDLVDDLSPAEVSVAMLVSTQLEANDLLRMVAYSFGLEEDLPHKAMIIQRLTRLLINHHKEGRRALLIIDEAQDLSVSALEELRLLTNLQLNSQPLLQIFLLGQEELKDLVHGPSMEQVHQRLVAAYDLEALKEDETKQYIKHRLDQVGWKGDPGLSEAVFPIIYKFSHGIPRRINLFCSRLFLHGSVEEQHKLGINDARIVIDELQLENLSSLTNLSEIDFDIHDTYESVDLKPTAKKPDTSKELADRSPIEEPLESSITTEPPVLSIQQSQHSRHNDQPGTRARIQEETTHPKIAENHLPAEDKQQNNSNNEKVLTQPVAEKPGKSENHSDEISRISRQEGQPPTAKKMSDQPAKSGNRFVTLVLLLSISLVLLAAVLFAVKPNILEAEIHAVDAWFNEMSDRMLVLFSENKELDELHDDADTSNTNKKLPPPGKLELTTSPVTEAVSMSEKETISRHQTNSKKLVDNNLDQTGYDTIDGFDVDQANPDPILDNVDKVVPNFPELHNKPEEEVINSILVAEQDSDSINQDGDAAPAEDIMSDDISDGDSVVDQSINEDAINTLDNIADKDSPEEANQLAKEIYFLFDSVDIQPEYLADLNKIAVQLDASPDKNALIIGYSDSAGNKEYNLDLSMKRAHAVASYLVSQGISTDRLRTDGRGARHREVESDSMTEKMIPDMNRLVEIYFIPSENQ